MTPSGVWTVVVAGGSSVRFGSDKLAQRIDDQRTALDLSITTAMTNSEGVVVVVPEGHASLEGEHPPELCFVIGGSSRSASVRRGLAAVPEGAEIVLVHDAARPLASDAIFARVVDAVRAGSDAAIPAVPVVDTIRTVAGDIVDRDTLRAVQTPQGFRASVLRRAHERAGEATDDAALVEALGHDVVLVDGDVRNLKITRPDDLTIARALIRDAG